MREECHSKFGGPVPEGKKNICEYEDVKGKKRKKKIYIYTLASLRRLIKQFLV